jgi:internalin A
MKMTFEQFISLPKEKLKNLTALNLSGQDIGNRETWEQKLFCQQLSQCTQLTVLNLSYNNLTTLPWAIEQLQALEWLSLNNNNFTTVPLSIRRLNALRVLDLSSNSIAEVPAVVGQLRALRALYLHNNCLFTLPKAIGLLSDLRLFHLHNNNFATLPEAIRSLNNLLEFCIDNNPLNDVDRILINKYLLPAIEKRKLFCSPCADKVLFFSGKHRTRTRLEIVLGKIRVLPSSEFRSRSCRG